MSDYEALEEQYKKEHPSMSKFDELLMHGIFSMCRILGVLATVGSFVAFCVFVMAVIGHGLLLL